MFITGGIDYTGSCYTLRMIKILLNWLPLFIVTTLLSLTLLVAVQQNYRLSANDPQIQFSLEVKELLAEGVPPEALLGENRIDFAQSLSPFVIIYDQAGSVVASTGYVDGQVPSMPQGVFAKTVKVGKTAFTWQPMKGVRTAVVVAKYETNGTTGFVLVGRSLSEIEARIMRLGLIVGLGWLATSIATLVFSIVVGRKKLPE